MFKNKIRCLSFLISVIMLTSVFLSMLTVTVSAQTPNLTSNNPKTHTACFTYKIRQTAINGTVLETVPKEANRNSPVCSNDYGYSVSNWMQIKTSGGSGGYCRCDMVCPANRCFKANASSGLRIRSTPSITASVVCTVADQTYLQIISVVGGSDMSYVRVRTGSYEGVTGYVVDNTYITEVNSDYVHG